LAEKKRSITFKTYKEGIALKERKGFNNKRLLVVLPCE
jgi:hypothetical protein